MSNNIRENLTADTKLESRAIAAMAEREHQIETLEAELCIVNQKHRETARRRTALVQRLLALGWEGPSEPESCVTGRAASAASRFAPLPIAGLPASRVDIDLTDGDVDYRVGHPDRGGCGE